VFKQNSLYEQAKHISVELNVFTFFILGYFSFWPPSFRLVFSILGWYGSLLRTVDNDNECSTDHRSAE
jgi:hypothetical protein